MTGSTDGDDDAAVREETVRVRERVLDTHSELLTDVIRCAHAVESERTTPITDGQALASTLEQRLGRTGVHERLPNLLRTAVDASGRSMAARPVAAPPYVVVTSRGPLVRATLSDCRLAVRIAVFDIERNPTRYVPGPETAEGALVVNFKY